MSRHLVFGLAIVLAAAGTGALAQTQLPPPAAYRPEPVKPTPGVSQPIPGRSSQASPSTSKLPWERDVDRLYKNSGPDATDSAVKKLYQDPMARLGLPPAIVPFNPSGQGAVAPTMPPTPDFNRLDSNRDGVVTQQEYAAGRSRTVQPLGTGSAQSLRAQALNQRGLSRFRQADRNGDGFISPDEYNNSRDSRF